MTHFLFSQWTAIRGRGRGAVYLTALHVSFSILFTRRGKSQCWKGSLTDGNRKAFLLYFPTLEQVGAKEENDSLLEMSTARHSCSQDSENDKEKMLPSSSPNTHLSILCWNKSHPFWEKVQLPWNSIQHTNNVLNFYSHFLKRTGLPYYFIVK